MKSLLYLQLIVVIMLVLSFTASPAAAQYDPQLGAVDEDGDLVLEEVQSPGLPGEGAFPVTLDFSNLPGGAVSADEVISVNSVPLSPVSSAIVKDKTPTFIFSKDGGASKYQIEVWNAYNATFVYRFKGSGDCGDTQCSLTPTTKLKTFIYAGSRGSYAWRVRSKTGDLWSPYSGFTGFTVVSNGFDYTFDTLPKNMLAVYGNWFRVDPGYLKTKGMTYEYASAIQQEWFEDRFVYEVTMKRKVNTIGEYPSNRVYFLGNVAGDVADGWDNGYEFIYFDDGFWYLNVRSGDSVTPIASGESPYINPYGWNKFTVLTDYPWVDFWINEHYLGYSTISDDAVKYTQGYVGFGGYKDIAKTSLLVDRARLYYSSFFPYSAAMSADGVRDPAYELTVDPTLIEPRE